MRGTCTRVAVCLTGLLLAAACQTDSPPAGSAAGAGQQAAQASEKQAGDEDQPVLAILDSLNRKDWAAVAGAFAPDGELVLIDSTQEPKKGRAAVAAVLENLALTVPDLHAVPVRIIAADSVWVVELVLSGTQLGELFAQPVSQRRLGVQLAVYARLEGGLIRKAFLCANPQAVIEQIRAAPAAPGRLPAAPARPEIEAGPAKSDPAAVRGFFGVFESGDLAQLENLVAEGIVVHAYGDGKTLSGLEALRLTLVREREAFDGRIKVEHLVAAGPYAAALVQVSGTLKADVGELKATGKTFAERGIDVFRIDGGKIVEWYNYRNLLDLKRQLGLLPAKI